MGIDFEKRIADLKLFEKTIIKSSFTKVLYGIRQIIDSKTGYLKFYGIAGSANGLQIPRTNERVARTPDSTNGKSTTERKAFLTGEDLQKLRQLQTDKSKNNHASVITPRRDHLTPGDLF